MLLPDRRQVVESISFMCHRKSFVPNGLRAVLAFFAQTADTIVFGVWGDRARHRASGAGSRMSSKSTTSGKSEGPSPKQLDRLNAALRAAEVAKTVARLTPARPAETYGKIRDERSKDNRISATPQ